MPASASRTDGEIEDDPRPFTIAPAMAGKCGTSAPSLILLRIRSSSSELRSQPLPAGPRDRLMIMATIGLIGAGHIGAQLARLAVAHGHDVVISNSRGPETLTELVTELGPKARAATPVEAAKAGQIVVVTIPLRHYRTVPVEPLAGKI